MFFRGPKYNISNPESAVNSVASCLIVAAQKSVPSKIVSQINDQKYFDLGQQRGCFASYYEDLVIPKDQNYDSLFLELCNILCNEVVDWGRFDGHKQRYRKCNR